MTVMNTKYFLPCPQMRHRKSFDQQTITDKCNFTKYILDNDWMGHPVYTMHCRVSLRICIAPPRFHAHILSRPRQSSCRLATAVSMAQTHAQAVQVHNLTWHARDPCSVDRFLDSLVQVGEVKQNNQIAPTLRLIVISNPGFP